MAGERALWPENVVPIPPTEIYVRYKPGALDILDIAR